MTASATASVRRGEAAAPACRKRGLGADLFGRLLRRFADVSKPLVIALASPLVLAAATIAPAAGPPTVSCDSAAMFAHPQKPTAGDRVLFDRVAVPPGFLQQVVRVEGPWAFWRKAGLLVRAGTRGVSVTVPRRWRDRAAIEWGDSGTTSGLRIAPCTRPPNRWNVYTGGFYLREPGCVPLLVRVGNRTKLVHFGVGRRC